MRNAKREIQREKPTAEYEMRNAECETRNAKFRVTNGPADGGNPEITGHKSDVDRCPLYPWHAIGSSQGMLLLGFRGFGRANRRAFVNVSHLGLMAGVALITASVVGGSGYMIRELHRQAGIASVVIGLPSSSVDPSLLVPVSSDMLKVSSIALGHAPVAIVNGAAIGEGAIVHLQTTNGVAAVRVVSIHDGMVQFKYGNQTLVANLR